MKTKCFLLFFLCSSVAFAAEKAERTDSLGVKERTETFHPRQLLLPSSLIFAGSWGVCNGFYRKVNRSVRDGMADLRGGHYFHADDYVQYLPIVSYVGLGVCGAPCRHSFKERLIVTATSYIALGAMTNGIKYSVKEKRPDSNARNSFPSGHTATAFMGAELVRTEYGRGYGIGAYTVATGIAFLRLYNDRHWLNDVLAGAGVGILSARIGYWMLPLNRKLFRMDKKKERTVVALPSYSMQDRHIGMTFVLTGL